MKYTKYESFSKGSLPRGCKLCLKGKKAVIFVTGKCSRNCFFCPLSKLRKNKDISYINERRIFSNKDLIEEIKNSGAKGCSLTGGDPLIKLNRTLNIAKKLKQKFGKKFHIHIYLSTKLVTENNLEKLSKYVNEVRFHPDLKKPLEEETKKIKLASKFWKKNKIGIELPMISNNSKKIILFLDEIKDYVSFLNLNEFESGEISQDYLLKKYTLNSDGYTIKNSIKSGLRLIKIIEKKYPKLKIHLCTARTKNWHQYRNRLKNYKIPKFFKQTEEGTNIYFSTKNKNLSKFLIKKDYYFDKSKNQFILNPKKVFEIKDNLKVYKIEEYPTYDREEVEKEILI